MIRTLQNGGGTGGAAGGGGGERSSEVGGDGGRALLGQLLFVIRPILDSSGKVVQTLDCIQSECAHISHHTDPSDVVIITHQPSHKSKQETQKQFKKTSLQKIKNTGPRVAYLRTHTTTTRYDTLNTHGH